MSALILQNLLTSGAVHTNAPTATTASFTTTTGRLTLLAINASPVGGNAQPSVVDANRGWFLLRHAQYDGSSGNGLTVFATTQGATGTLTIDFGVANPESAIQWSVHEFPNAGAVRQITAVATGTGTAALATLAATPQPLSATFAIHAAPAVETFTEASGFTEITDFTDGGGICSMETQFRNDPVTACGSTLSSSANWGSIAIEIGFGESSGPRFGSSGSTIVAVTAGGNASAAFVDITIPATKPGSALVAFGQWSGSTDAAHNFQNGGGTWVQVTSDGGSGKSECWVNYGVTTGTTSIRMSNNATATGLNAQVYEVQGLVPNGRVSITGLFTSAAVAARMVLSDVLAFAFPARAFTYFDNRTTGGAPASTAQGGELVTYTGTGVAGGYTNAAGGGALYSETGEYPPTTITQPSVLWSQGVAGRAYAVAFEVAARPPLPKNGPTKRTLAYDSGVGADANPVGGRWAAAIGAMQRLSNTFTGVTAATFNAIYDTGAVYGPDQWAEVVISTNTDGDVSPVVRASSTNCYSFSPRTTANGGWIIEKRVAGGTTQLAADATRTSKANDVARIEVRGSVISAYLNGVLWTQVTDTDLTTGAPGMAVWATSANNLTMWRGGDILATPQASRRRRRHKDVSGGYDAAGWYSRQLLAANQYSKWILNQPTGGGGGAAALAATPAVACTVTAALTTGIPLAATVAAVTTVTDALTTQIKLAAAVAAVTTVTDALTTQIKLAAAVAAVTTVTDALTTGIPLAAAVAAVTTVTDALTTGITLAAAVAAVTTVTSDLTTGVGGAALAATPAVACTVTAALTTGINLAATVAAVTTVTDALTTGIQLAATVAAVTTVTDALTTQIKLAAAVAAVTTVTDALTTQIKLAAAVAAVTTVTDALTTGIPLAAAVAAVTTVTDALTTQIALAAAPAAVTTLSAALSTAIQMASAPAAVTTVTADLTANGTAAALASTVQAITTVAAGLTTGIKLASTVAAVTTVTPGLTTGIPLAATPAAAATVTAGLTTGISLLASAAAITSATAALTTGIKLASAAASTTTVIADLTTNIRLAAAVAAVTSATAALTVGAYLTAAPSAACTVTASLTTGIRLLAAVQAITSVSCYLFGTSLYTPDSVRRIYAQVRYTSIYGASLTSVIADPTAPIYGAGLTSVAGSFRPFTAYEL